MPRLFHLVYGIAALLGTSSNAYPMCDPDKGRPNAEHCRQLLRGMKDTSPTPYGRHETHTQLFASASLHEPPPELANGQQWYNRQLIPKFWESPLYPQCKVGIFPTMNATGHISYDLGNWMSLEAAGRGITHVCIDGMGMLGQGGTGGEDAVGNNRQMMLVLYGPNSQFENWVKHTYKNNLVVALKPRKRKSSHDPESSPQDPRKRPHSSPGSTGAPRKQASSTLKTLSGGWKLEYDSIKPVAPSQSAGAEFRSLYADVMKSAADQLSNGVDEAPSLLFQKGNLKLRLSSADPTQPIGWDWVIQYASLMADNVATGFQNLYTAQAYSTYWDLAGVIIALGLNFGGGELPKLSG